MSDVRVRAIGCTRQGADFVVNLAIEERRTENGQTRWANIGGKAVTVPDKATDADIKATGEAAKIETAIATVEAAEFTARVNRILEARD